MNNIRNNIVTRIHASSEDGPEWAARNVAEWNWRSCWRACGETEGAWVQIDFAGLQRVGAVQLVDRANELGEVAALRLSFSDGSHVDYQLPPHPDYPGLDQPGTIYTPVDEHILAGYASASKGVVHSWDAHAFALEYSRNKGSFFIRFEPRLTEYVRVTIVEMVRKPARAAFPSTVFTLDEPFAASLAFVRPVIMPEDAQPLAGDEQLRLAARRGFALNSETPTAPWSLRNEEFDLEISPATGLVSRFTSRLPVPVDLCADDQRGAGAVLYVQCVDRGWEDRFNRLLSWRRQEGREGGQEFQELECLIAPGKYPVATATVRYRLFPDRLEQKLRFDYLVDDWARYRMGLYHRADTKKWPEHRDTGGWTPTDNAYVKAYSHAYDLCWEQGDWYCLMWPLDVLRRDDRYLAWGSFDLQGPHLVMGPHIPAADAYPSVYYMPLSLTKNDSYTLDLFWKSFPREKNGYAEVLNWYGRRTYFNDPELTGIPVCLSQERPRTLHGGGRLAPSARPACTMESEEHLRKVERAMVKAGVRHVVYGGWDLWCHAPETIVEGSDWKADDGRLSTGKMKRDIQASREAGLLSYIYINNFCKPPWRDGDIIDPDNAEEREWYLARVKSFFRILKPDGVFWDTGWHPISWASPNIWISSNPRGDQLKGWLKIFARLYAWIKDNYPEACVISGSPAAPTAYFSDAVHTEGDFIANPMATEDAKAFMQPVFGYWIPPYDDLGLAVLAERGLKLEDLVETGLPQDVEEEVWQRWMARGLKSIGMGRSLVTQGEVLLDPETVQRRTVYPRWRRWYFEMPQTRKVPELDRFCARSPALPLVWESRCLNTGQEQTLGSVWAGKDEMLVSLFRDGDDAATVHAQIDRALLNAYGFTRPDDKPEIHVLSPLAFNQPDRTLQCTVEKDAILLQGELRPGELALISWAAKKVEL